MSLAPAEQEARRALVDAARKALDAEQSDLAEDTLHKVRARFGESAQLHDVWTDLCDQKGERVQALDHSKRAWSLEPTPWRGLNVADRLPDSEALSFLRIVLSEFADEDRVVIAVVHAELAVGGFEAGDTASSVLVDLISGGSADLMEAMAKVLEGQDLDSDAMMAFQPLVSAEITRRVREERLADGEQVREVDDPTNDEMVISATMSIPPTDFEDEPVMDDSTAALRQRAIAMADRQRIRSVQSADLEPWRRTVEPWLPLVAAAPGLLLAIGFAFLGFRDTLVVSNSLPLVAWVTIPTVLSFLGTAASARVRGAEVRISTVLIGPVISCVMCAGLLGLGGIALEQVSNELVGRMGIFLLAAVGWGGSGLVGLKLAD
jgi:hypothetical protein